MREPLPLATIQTAILDVLRNREDAVVFGAQAVNAYVSESRMTETVNLMSTRAEALAGELRTYLSGQFYVAVRLRRVANGRGLRLFQLRKEGNRHLVDLRVVETLPPARRIEQVLVLDPVDLVATKILALHQRRGRPKAGTDWRDVAMLLLTFPELKREDGSVAERLRAMQVEEAVLNVWRDFVSQPIEMEDDEDEFDGWL